MEVSTVKCPYCFRVQAPPKDNKCEKCDEEIHVRSFRTVATMPVPQVTKMALVERENQAANPTDNSTNTSLGVCYLRLKQYPKALESFEKAMPENFENPEPFFLAAISLLQGKKAFLTPRASVDKALSYLESAAMIEMRPVFYAMRAYLKADYYERKFLNISPSWKEELATAQDLGLGEADLAELFDLLGVARPDYM